MIAHDGDKYVELDSDTKRGGDNAPTNSSMTRRVSLTAGTYKLTFFYQPRTSVVNDNIIDVYLAGAGAALNETLLGTANETNPPVNFWKEYNYTFYVDGTRNDYAITFEAGGRQNTLGGFIDSVSLAAIPLPASFFLMAGALGALGAGYRRAGRRKAA